MTAAKYDVDKVEKWLGFEGGFIQFKYDGIRCYISDGVAYSRSAKPLRSEQIQTWVSRNREAMEGLDGEFIIGDPTDPDCFRKTTSHVQSFNNPHPDIRYYAFDVWNIDLDFIARRDVVRSKVHKIDPSGGCRILHAEDTHVYEIEEISALEGDAISLGHEGLILRRSYSRYKNGRATPISGELIKIKRFHDMEARVTGFKEEMENTNEATTNALGYTERSGHKDNLIGKGVLGAVEASGYYEDGTEFTVSIGSGFTAAQREEYWRDRESLIGKYVKFKYFATGSKDAPRFPTFLGFRDTDDIDVENGMRDLFDD